MAPIDERSELISRQTRLGIISPELMNIYIRQETLEDYPAVSNVIQQTYRSVAYSNKKEHLMVERLRKSSTFIPQLSLVAQADTDELVGHILFTKLHIQDGQQRFPGLALAPLSIPMPFNSKASVVN